jgi:hypothetical protein
MAQERGQKQGAEERTRARAKEKSGAKSASVAVKYRILAQVRVAWLGERRFFCCACPTSHSTEQALCALCIMTVYPTLGLLTLKQTGSKESSFVAEAEGLVGLKGGLWVGPKAPPLRSPPHFICPPLRSWGKFCFPNGVMILPTGTPCSAIFRK